MRATTKTTYGMAAALALLLTLSASVKADTDIVANGALNFFFPHGAVSLAIGEPLHRHYGHSDYRYEKRRYAPEYRKGHYYDRHDHKYYKKAPKHYVVIEQPHRRHPVFIDHPRQNSHARKHHNDWRDSEPARGDYRNERKSGESHKRERKGADNKHYKYGH